MKTPHYEEYDTSAMVTAHLEIGRDGRHPGPRPGDHQCDADVVGDVLKKQIDDVNERHAALCVERDS